MVIGRSVVATQAGIGFRGILHGLEVVSNRDDRKQDEQQHGQRNNLHAGLAGARRSPRPQP